jgi:hypothetical protein
MAEKSGHQNEGIQEAKTEDMKFMRRTAGYSLLVPQNK